MTLPVIVLPSADLDIAAAIRHYNKHRLGYGELFRLELDRTIGIIARWPEAYEQVTPRLRRAVLHRFQHAVIYRPFPACIRVVGVIPTRRDPAIFPGLDTP